MAIATQYVLHGIQNSSSFISQITSAAPAPGIQTMVAMAAGFPEPLFVGNMRQAPEVSFESGQIKTILDLTGISIADLSGANTDLLYKKVDNLGSRVADATAEHIRLRMANAVLGCGSIRAGHDSPASAGCLLVNPYDGSNEPIVPAGSIALSGTPTSAEHFVCGPVYINGSQLVGVQSVSIDFGRQWMRTGGDGELYNTFAAEMSISPTITIDTTTLPAWTTLGLNGTAITSLSVYLRRIATTGRVANGTASHIKFSATAGLAFVQQTSDGLSGPAATSVRCELIAPTASGNAISLNTATAITT